MRVKLALMAAGLATMVYGISTGLAWGGYLAGRLYDNWSAFPSAFRGLDAEQRVVRALQLVNSWAPYLLSLVTSLALVVLGRWLFLSPRAVRLVTDANGSSQ